jgi:transposase
MSLGDSIREVAEMVGYSQKWVREIARRYESEGVEGLGDRRHGNPGAKQRALLDEEGQARLRQALLEEAPPGAGMWSGPKVARWIEQKIAIEKVHAQRGWEYLTKVGHSPQVPRPSNAQGADSEEREAFKKASGEAGGAQASTSGRRSTVVGTGRGALGPKASDSESMGTGGQEEARMCSLQERLQVDLSLRLRAARKWRGVVADRTYGQRKAVLDGAQ